MTESEPPVDQLRMLVLRRLLDLGSKGKPLSPREAVDRHPGALSYTYLYDIFNGKRTKQIRDKTIRGLATVLEIPVGEVYDAVGAPRPQTRWAWPEVFDRVAPEHRAMFEDLVAAFLAAERRGYERGRQERA